MKRESLKKGIYLLPNFFTTANLFCGFFSMIRTLNGDYLVAAWILFLAGLFDFLDGRVARLTKTSSRFGLEYDSLSDITSFGIAPALLMYKWSLFNFGRLGWAVAFLFFACGALRLARFNVQSASVEKKDFQGLPIPTAAACPTSYVILHHHYYGGGTTESYFVLVLTLVVALLMVSRIPYRSLKMIDQNPRVHFILLVLLVGIVGLLAAAPQIMLFVAAMGYMLLGIAEQILKSPQKIYGFAELLKRTFYEVPRDKRRVKKMIREQALLKVVGMKREEEGKGKS